MKSMTGYGRASAALGAKTLTVQVSSVNRKTLDLAVLLPREWDELEPELADQVRAVVARGKVLVRVELTGNAGTADCDWNNAAVGEILDRLMALADSRGVDFRETPELLWRVACSQQTAGIQTTAAQARSALTVLLEEALRAFVAMRSREGEALLIDFLKRLETLKRHLDTIVERAPSVAPTYRENLLKRLREAGLELDVQDERVLKEISLFADRCDISEEVTRLRSHLGQFASFLHAEGEIGRKAEFILQEISREVNTIGSKANDIMISRAVIELKNELERIREQIANVE